MVNICSTPCRKLVYAWLSRRRFSAVRGIHDQGWAFVACRWLLVCFDQVDLVHRWHVGGIAVVRDDCVHI